MPGVFTVEPLGMGRYCRELRDAIHRQGARCEWVCVPSEHEDTASRGQYTPIVPWVARRRVLAGVVRPFALAREARRLRPNMVLLCFSNQNEAWLAELLLKMVARRATVVVFAHDPVLHFHNLPAVLHWLEDWVVRLHLRLADTVVVHTEAGAAVLRERDNVAPVKMMVVGLPPPTDVQDVNHERSGVSVVGALRPDKDVMGVVRAHQRLDDTVRAAHPLSIRGAVIPESDPETVTHVRWAGESDRAVSAKLEVLTREELIDHLCRAKVVVMPYVNFESSSWLVLDALAAGCRVLASGGGSLADLRRRGLVGEWPTDERARVGALAEALTGDGVDPRGAMEGFPTWDDVARQVLRTHTVSGE